MMIVKICKIDENMVLYGLYTRYGQLFLVFRYMLKKEKGNYIKQVNVVKRVLTHPWNNIVDLCPKTESQG